MVFEVKVVVVGDADAGKTSLSERFCFGDMPADTSPTVGASFLQKRVHIQAETGDELSHCSFGTQLDKNAFAAWLQCTTVELLQP